VNPFDLYGEDPQAVQAQAQALADAMMRRRAAGTVATVIGGSYANAGKAFLGDADQSGAMLGQAGQFQGQQKMLRGRMAADAAQHQAQLAAQALARQQQAAQFDQELALKREALAQDAWKVVPDVSGGGGGFKVNSKTGEVMPLQPPNPLGPGLPKLPTFKNEDQSKSFSYSERMREARKQMEEAGYPAGVSGRKDAAAMGAQSGPISSLVPQEAASEQGGRYFNAARNLVAALLRKESGAAISNDEWKQFTGLYVPMPWDSPEARSNKLRMLDLMQKSMEAAAGPSAQQYWQATGKPPLPATSSAAPAAAGPKRAQGKDGKWYVNDGSGWRAE
jgi:hypothetical protein